MENTVLAIMILFGGICGLIGMVISLICLACVIGFTRSTHNIQYVPLKDTVAEVADKIATEDEELEEEMKKVGRKKKTTLVSEAEQEIAEVSQSDFLN